MKKTGLFIVVCLVFQTINCKFPFPDVENKKLFMIEDIKHNETFELYFKKPAMVEESKSYAYNNKNNKIRLMTWDAYYYIIDTGDLVQTRDVDKNIVPTMQDVRLFYSVLIDNCSYPKHIYTDKDVKLFYKVWTTNNTLFDGSKYFSNSTHSTM